MCDDSPAERMYWIAKMEEMRKQMEQEEKEHQRKPAAAPAAPGKGVEQEEPVPV